MSEQTQEDRELTFGERAVGLTFNPSQDPDVKEIKELSAKLIDKVEALHQKRDQSNYLRNTIHGKAIRAQMTAQMWLVKDVTFEQDPQPAEEENAPADEEE